ncbi:hypothetical protein BGZ94_004367 [Podila epigama]|nr:hypothetical protein BGZ94_004367 [Podila epigama]
MSLTLGVLVTVSIPKVSSILGEANLVSVSMEDSNQIPVPSVLICGRLLDTVDVEMISRGYVYDNGTVDMDHKRLVPDFGLRANGDWPKIGKCLTFTPVGLYYAKNPGGRDMDGNVSVYEQQPIRNGIPSINTMTFIYSEHILLDKRKQTRYTVQKQNMRMMQAGFFNNKIIGRFILSPDTFFVSKYIDRPSYTWVDLAGALGGMASLALAVWIFLFGNGKYKSWGVMQRYVLQTSPNSRRFRNENEIGTEKSIVERLKDTAKNVVARLNGTTDNDLDRVPLQATAAATAQERRRLSARYSKAAGDAAVSGVTGAAAASVAQLHSRSAAAAATGGGRHSLEQPMFYFSEHGAPGSRSLQPLAPMNESGDDVEEQVDELIRLIDLRIDERMWSLEKTLSRYYLDGFRLRDYSSMLAHNVTQDNSTTTTMSGFVDSSSPNSLQIPTHMPQQQQQQQQHGPSYPPRPMVSQQYHVVDPPYNARTQSNNTIATIDSTTGASSLPPSSSDAAMYSQTSLVNTGFPPRRDMRGTIRRAVERLQQEWPQDPTAYVPQTRYSSDQPQQQQQQQQQQHQHFP